MTLLRIVYSIYTQATTSIVDSRTDWDLPKN